MSANPQAFARKVLDAFAAVGLATDAQVIAAGGPSTTTMTKLRKVADGAEDMAEPREPTWSKIDRAAQWDYGSARSVWRGRDPRPRLSAEEESRLAESIDDVALIVAAFDALTGPQRELIRAIAYDLARITEDAEYADWLIRDSTSGHMALEVRADTSRPELHEAIDPIAVEALWDLPEGSAVVTAIFTPDGRDDGFVAFHRVPAPAVRSRFALAARDIGKASRGQRDRDALDQAGEPPPDDPEDMEPR